MNPPASSRKTRRLPIIQRTIFFCFSHPGLSLRKEYKYPASIIIRFWISGTIKMALEGTRFPASTICIEGNKRSGKGQKYNAFRVGPVICQTNCFLEQG